MSDSVFDVKEELTGTALDRMMKLAGEAISQEEFIEGLTENLAAAKRILNDIKTKQLPDLMAEVGQTQFTHTATGYTLELKSFVSGSLPNKDKEPEKRAKALALLVENKAQDLIKTIITVTMGRNSHNQATLLTSFLKEHEFDFDSEEGVHAQTLQAHARLVLASGGKLPLAELGLFSGNMVKISPPEEPKKKKVKAK